MVEASLSSAPTLTKLSSGFDTAFLFFAAVCFDGVCSVAVLLLLEARHLPSPFLKRAPLLSVFVSGQSRRRWLGSPYPYHARESTRGTAPISVHVCMKPTLPLFVSAATRFWLYFSVVVGW